MAQQSAFTTVTLRRLPQGESLQITISGNKALNILRDKDTGAERPALSSTNPLILTPKVYGTSGTRAAMSNCSWQLLIDDVDKGISNIGSYTTGDTSSVYGGKLTITKSPIAAGLISSPEPFTLVFKGTATLNGHSYDVTKTVVVNYAETSQNSYWGLISASHGTTLDSSVRSTTLTPRLYLGVSEVTNFTVKWYKTGAGEDGSDLEITSDNASELHVTINGNKLIVTSDAVDAAAHFEAHFYVSGTEVEAEGVSIVDVTDVVQVEQIADQYVATGGTASITVRAYSSKTGASFTIEDGNVSVVATDSIRQRTYDSSCTTVTVADGVGTIKMSESSMYVPYAGSDGKQTKTDNQLNWAICGDSASDDTSTTDVTKATKCEVILLVGVTIVLS